LAIAKLVKLRLLLTQLTKGEDVILWAIGQKASTVAQVVNVLQEGERWTTIVVANNKPAYYNTWLLTPAQPWRKAAS